MIEIDGSRGEGGGQILRSSLTLSLMTGKPFRLRRIRSGRQKPGLQPQHLQCVLAAKEIGQAEVKGASLGSESITFEPGEVLGGDFDFSIGTAGSACLLIQTIWLPLATVAQSSSSIRVGGGTHVPFSPCFHFLSTTWAGFLRLMKLDAHFHMIRPGFYPRGGGKIELTIQPNQEVSSLDLVNRTGVRLSGTSLVAGLPASVAERQAKRAEEILHKAGHPLRSEILEMQGGPGTVFLVQAELEGVSIVVSALGARGKPAEQVGQEAAEEMLRYLQAVEMVDPHSADQILLPLATARGSSRYTITEVTQHLLTNMEVVQKFLDRDIRCKGSLGEPGMVTIE